MGTGMGGQGASVGGQGAGMGGQGSAMGGQGSGGFGGANNYQQSSQINYVAGNPDEPFAPPDSETKRRLFIVSHPERISTRDLSAMFRKFGNFISVNYIPGILSQSTTYIVSQSINHIPRIVNSVIRCVCHASSLL